MKRHLVVGFSSWNAPGDGMGPFKSIFTHSKSMNEFTDFSLIDALILWGGNDISPSLYGETPIIESGPPAATMRDRYEWELLRQAKQANIPIIGICRGAQLLCAFAGGTLIQDVTGHQTNHWIVTHDKQILNTFGAHHQMMSPNNIQHEVLAWPEKHLSNHYNPPDTYGAAQLDKQLIQEPEIIYFPKVNGMGIQFHPEWDKPDSITNKWLTKLLTTYFTSLGVKNETRS